MRSWSWVVCKLGGEVSQGISGWDFSGKSLVLYEVKTCLSVHISYKAIQVTQAAIRIVD